MINVYKFIETRDVVIETNIIGRPFSNEWLEIDEVGKITIKGTHWKGYAWDGCSPKWYFLDLIIGTPDGRPYKGSRHPITYYASMCHDVLYQFKKHHYISRKEADVLFYAMLKANRFFWARVYFIAVRLFGWMYGSFRKKSKGFVFIEFQKLKVQNQH